MNGNGNEKLLFFRNLFVGVNSSGSVTFFFFMKSVSIVGKVQSSFVDFFFQVRKFYRSGENLAIDNSFKLLRVKAGYNLSQKLKRGKIRSPKRRQPSLPPLHLCPLSMYITTLPFFLLLH